MKISLTYISLARHGALIGGERIGADSGFRVNEAEGVDFGNFLNASLFVVLVI